MYHAAQFDRFEFNICLMDRGGDLQCVPREGRSRKKKNNEKIKNKTDNLFVLNYQTFVTRALHTHTTGGASTGTMSILFRVIKVVIRLLLV